MKLPSAVGISLPLRQLKYLTAIEIIYEDLSVSLKISMPV